MALLSSKALKPRFICPQFSLLSVENKPVSLSDFSSSKALLVAFICNHCPYVRAIEDRLLTLRKDFSLKDLGMVGICSNDAQKYPEDGAVELLRRWTEKSYGFPYLIDADQSVAKSFDAVCTPDLFLFDKERRLFYHGQLDDNWQDESKVTSQDLKEAIKMILADLSPPKEQKPSMGCSIKWQS